MEHTDRVAILRRQFDTTKNRLKFEEYRNLDKVWWICPLGHSYQSLLANRLNKGSDCPICSNHQVIRGFNDLESKHPELAEEWHPTKNTCKPYQVMFRSTKKAWWMCPYGHEYEAKIEVRERNGTGCPICANKDRKSVV